MGGDISVDSEVAVVTLSISRPTGHKSISSRVPQKAFGTNDLGHVWDRAGQKETKNLYKKEALPSRVPQTASGCMHFNRGDHPMWEK